MRPALTFTTLPLVIAAAALTFASGHAEAQLTQIGAGAAGAVGGTLRNAAGAVGAGAVHAGGVGDALPRSTDAVAGGRLQGELRGRLRLSGVKSEVSHGVARLRGTVATEADKRRAARIARRIDGVTGVRNEITVQARSGDAKARGDNGKAAANASLGAAVKSNIDASGPLRQRAIRVEQTNKGTVRLSGEVHSEAEKEMAGRIAANTRAVADVDNDIVVHRAGKSGSGQAATDRNSASGGRAQID